MVSTSIPTLGPIGKGGFYKNMCECLSTKVPDPWLNRHSSCITKVYKMGVIYALVQYIKYVTRTKCQISIPITHRPTSICPTLGISS